MNDRQRSEAALLDRTTGSVGVRLKRLFNVTPAKAGVQRLSRTMPVERLDPRFRGDDRAAAASMPVRLSPAYDALRKANCIL
jgi:hypothetical protein